MKKELAIVLGSTGNMTFALANVLMGLKKYCNSSFDTIIFEQNISSNDKELLSYFINCEFRDYKYPYENVQHAEAAIKRFTEMAFSRYECFDLLEHYQTVIWLDIDLLIQGDITTLKNEISGEIALWLSTKPLKINFMKELPEYNLEIPFYNSGVIVFKDTIKNPGELKNWCYQKTNELASVLYCPDQGVINLMLQEFSIEPSKLPEKYNCNPRLKNAKLAKIQHPYCAEKFWNFYINGLWNKNYKQWVKMGGSPYTGTKAGFFERMVKHKYPEVPNPLKYPKNFFKYFKTQKYKDFDF